MATLRAQNAGVCAFNLVVRTVTTPGFTRYTEQCLMYTAAIPATSAEKHKTSKTCTLRSRAGLEPKTPMSKQKAIHVFKPVGVPASLTYKNISTHEQHIKNEHSARTAAAIHKSQNKYPQIRFRPEKRACGVPLQTRCNTDVSRK